MSSLKVKSRSNEQKKAINNGINLLAIESNDSSKVTKKKAIKGESMKQKKEKRMKDPLAPKKPMTAFILFGNDMRPKLKAEMPHLTFGAVGKELGKRWKESTPEVKNKYQEMAQIDKQRYAEEMQNYKQICV